MNIPELKMLIRHSKPKKKKKEEKLGFIQYCTVECVPQLTQSND